MKRPSPIRKRLFITLPKNPQKLRRSNRRQFRLDRFWLDQVWQLSAQSQQNRSIRAVAMPRQRQRPIQFRQHSRHTTNLCSRLQPARKIRRLYQDKILAGFAGSTADAFSLFSRFESKLEQYAGKAGGGAAVDALMRRLKHVRSGGTFTRDEMNER